VILLILCIRDYTSPNVNGRDSLIDLSFITNPSLLCNCTVIPPLANSDHYGVHTIFNLKSSASTFTSQRPRKVWCYAHADFSKACHLISDTDWNSIISDNIDHSWMQWQERFLAIMEECIPRKVLPPRRNLPWLNKGIIQSIRRRNNLFKRAKNSPKDKGRYKRARNRVISQLRNAKRDYFRKLNPSNPKQFWKSVKILNKQNSSIPVLSQDSNMYSTDKEKADALNLFSLKMILAPICFAL